ncbi:hypothetical protein H257_16495 [Aphanomyces astaci]|uniref:HTH CENPB-type domain-containing protein n=1 Tax=Aphanomyces astaci TaxID=112090 RepID=W4FIA8_APHAT|nr:hypothetical protein H257_16495 [Aphanomyces astaci]ETV67252.1 hypothetical protein H257_16495 [Aphanomyces astaci]|eukprot:XP_009843240.1 hypothetical protein H257_16495 [Aphanomyces astaci]
MAPTELDGRRTGRPNTKQIKRMPKKHKNLYHTYEKKLHIINWRKEHSMESVIDTFFPGVAGDKRTTARTRDMHTPRVQGNGCGVGTRLSSDQFKASPSWMKGFMMRWGLAIRAETRSGQANVADGEKALAEFKTSIRKVIKDNRIVEVFNADQTGINYEYLPKQTMDKKGAKTVWIKVSGHDKDRVTAMPLADSKGTKYPEE